MYDNTQLFFRQRAHILNRVQKSVKLVKRFPWYFYFYILDPFSNNSQFFLSTDKYSIKCFKKIRKIFLFKYSQKFFFRLFDNIFYWNDLFSFLFTILINLEIKRYPYFYKLAPVITDKSDHSSYFSWIIELLNKNANLNIILFFIRLQNLKLCKSFIKQIQENLLQCIKCSGWFIMLNQKF